MKTRKLGLIVLFLSLLGVGICARGQTLRTIYTFANTNGAFPQSGLTAAGDGNYYGTTYSGGLAYLGTVYRVSQAGQITTIISFTGTNGANPMGGLTLGKDGFLYGTTEFGGPTFGGPTNLSYPDGAGTVFKMSTNGQLTTVAYFNSTNGSQPCAAMILANDGCLYGTTLYGGVRNMGTVYKVGANGVFQSLALITNGSNPYFPLVQNTDGLLYGTTYSGGSNSDGTAFAVTTNGILTSLCSFASSNRYPNGLVMIGNGQLLGTTEFGGGVSNGGTVFLLSTNGVIQTTSSFPGNARPQAELTAGNDGNFYGLSTSNLFQITPAGNLIIIGTLPAVMSPASATRAQLLLLASGQFLGTCNAGGNHQVGLVFQTDIYGNMTNLFSFDGVVGVSPGQTLTLGQDGWLYGVCSQGGIGYGTVFKVSPAGQETNLSWFGSTNGATPSVSLFQTPNGLLYGATYAGGATGQTPSQGTVYSISTNGALSLLNSFNTSSNGALPSSSLSLGFDGNLYGTTRYTGLTSQNVLGTVTYSYNGYGSIYRLSTNGILAPVFQFSSSDINPEGGLTMGPDGFYYGTCETSSYNSYSGYPIYGSVYKISTNFSTAMYFPFGLTNGAVPQGNLVVGLDNNLYGTTYSGGISNLNYYPSTAGTAFRLGTNGVFSTIHFFNSTNDGVFPGQLLLGRDGCLYGTTARYGTSQENGSIFQLGTNGQYSTLYVFPKTKGFVGNGLTYGPDGLFYGTTYSDPDDNGSVFQFCVPPAFISQPVSQTNAAGSTAYFSAAVACPNPVSYQWQFGGTNLVDGAGYSGTQAAVISIANVGSNDIGTYSLIISNLAGSSQSQPVSLGVVYTPLISSQSAQAFSPFGGTLQLDTVAYSSSPLTCQWQLNGTNVSSATNLVLTITNALPANGGVYQCLLSNSFGMVTSAPISAVVFSILQNPTNVIAIFGQTATDSVVVSPTNGITYQWLFNGSNLPPMISTVGGSSRSFSLGDGGPATNGWLNYPSDVKVDSQGNMFIADSANERVREILTNGVIITIAGNGIGGYSQDNIAATNSWLQSPKGVAVDANEVVYIADTANSRIRKVGANGIISTIAGTGIAGYTGDGGLATIARINSPYGIIVDSQGNVFFADSSNHCVRKISPDGLIHTVAGIGIQGYVGDGGSATNALLKSPEGVALNTTGNLLIADTGNSVIREVDASGKIFTVAGSGTSGYSGDGGLASLAKLAAPVAVASDAVGNIYIADNGNNRLRVVGTNNLIQTYGGNGSRLNTYGNLGIGPNGDGWTATAATLTPLGFCLDAGGNLIVADYGTYRIRRLSPNTQTTLTIGAAPANCVGNYSVAIAGVTTSSVAALNLAAYVASPPASLTVLPGGNAQFSFTAGSTGPFSSQWYFNGETLPNATSNSLLVANCNSNLAGGYYLSVSNSYGGTLSQTATLTVAYITAQPAIVDAPQNGTATFGVTLSATNKISYEWQHDGTNLPLGGVMFTIAGTGSPGYSGDNGPATNAAVSIPGGVAVDSRGNVFIADTGNSRIREVTPSGTITTVAGNGSSGYSGDGGMATNASLSSPSGVALDALGDLFIADSGNQCVREIFTNGIIQTIAGNGSPGFSGDGGPATNAEFDLPAALTVVPGGTVYISDTWNNRVRAVDTNGIVRTIAGFSTPFYNGDGIAATNAGVWLPGGIAVDSQRHWIYFADMGNTRVRGIDPNGIIWTVAGSGPGSSAIGDGGAATNATIMEPQGLSLTSDGILFVTENTRVREVFTNGIITTVAGNGSPGFNGDTNIATAASVNIPKGVAVDANGIVYIADTSNDRIRRLQSIPTLLAYTPTLTIDGVTAAEAGQYSVVLTDSSGNSYSSAPAALTEYLSLANLSLTDTNGVMTVSFQGTPNQLYELQFSPSLAPVATWITIITTASDTNGAWQAQVPRRSGNASGFYRVLIP